MAQTYLSFDIVLGLGGGSGEGMGGMLTSDEMLKHQVNLYFDHKHLNFAREQLWLNKHSSLLIYSFTGSIKPNSECYDSKA